MRTIKRLLLRSRTKNTPAKSQDNERNMNEDEQRELQRKHKEESSAMMRRVLIMGAVKLLVLAAISGVFVYWYMA